MSLGRLRFVTPLLLLGCGDALAGGSGLNVVVVVNSSSSNSVALGNYYCEMRQVPPQNVIRMSNWAGGNISWTLEQFTNRLLTPLYSAIKNRGLTNQADFVLLSMDIPYRVQEGQNANSTTAAIYYGFKTNGTSPVPGEPTCALPNASSNKYAGTEFHFRDVYTRPASWSNLMASMVTGSNLSGAKWPITRGVTSDSTFPTNPALLVKSTDLARSKRHPLFDTAVFDSMVHGVREVRRTNLNGVNFGRTVSGAQTGAYNYNPFQASFDAGSLADNLTSLSGSIFEQGWPSGHLTGLQLLSAGASGSYGTIVEPCAYFEKFPTPSIYNYQARGFGLAEAYYLSVTNPFQGLVLGEPLAAPFAVTPFAYWTNVPTIPLSGSVNLSLQTLGTTAAQMVSRAELFVDGVWLKTLTNIPPSQGNTVTAIVDGTSASYTVGAGASLNSVASGLAASLNTKIAQTKARATAVGDRIVLRLEDRTLGASSTSLAAQSAKGTAQSLTTRAAAAQGTFLPSVAYGVRSYVVTGNPTNRWLAFTMTKTNGTQVTIGVTNISDLSLYSLCDGLISSVNTNSNLTGPDGVIAEDVLNYGTEVHFTLRSRSAGWDAAQFRADAAAPTGLTVSPSSADTLEDNILDLQPRAHIYITSGLTNVPITFPLDTTTLANGHHELTAVIMEGSNAKAQRRVSTSVVVQNGTPGGSIVTLVGGTNSALEATLQFRVAGTGGTVTKIELFTTGGVFGSSTLASADFSVPGAYLGSGLHPVYGIVTFSTGKQYRTQTQWIRVLDYEPSFRVSATNSPLSISWPATAGRSYTVLTSTNVATGYFPAGTVIPTNNLGLWPITNLPLRQFYRVRTTSG